MLPRRVGVARPETNVCHGTKMASRNDGPGERERLLTLLPLEEESRGAGCGVRGCLVVAIIGFVLLLAAMVTLALTRTWTTPVVGY